MNSAPLPLIMVAMAPNETTTEIRHAAPKRQSRAKSSTSKPTTMAAAPAISGSMCASKGLGGGGASVYNTAQLTGGVRVKVAKRQQAGARS